MTEPLPFADAAITYGPTGVRCGCSRDAHSNLSPCREAAPSQGNAYCTGDRCEECTPEEPCCEATCGPCGQADCYLRPGSEDGSRYCDEHGEGWLSDRSPKSQLMYDILRNAQCTTAAPTTQPTEN